MYQIILLYTLNLTQCYMGGTACKESTCQGRRLRFHPWFRKIPWGRKWQHSSILAWEMPWTEEPGGLQSMGSKSWTRLNNNNKNLL